MSGRLALCVILLLVLLSAAQVSAQDRPDVTVLTPFRVRAASDAATPAGAEAPPSPDLTEIAGRLTEELRIALRLLSDSPVEVAGFLFPDRHFDRVELYYDERDAESAVFGSVTLSAADQLLIGAGVWTREDGLVEIESTLRSGAEIEAVVLEMIPRVVEELLGRPIRYGVLEIENADWLRSFTVYLDGVFVAQNQTRLLLPTGERELIVARRGELGDEPVAELPVRVSEDASTSVRLESPETPVAEEGPPAQASAGAPGSQAAGQGIGRLRVDLSPEGATVWFDGSPIGETPLDRFGIPAGRYELRVEREYFRPVSRAVTIVADDSTEFSAELEVDPEHPEVAAMIVSPERAALNAGLGTLLQGVGSLATFLSRSYPLGQTGPLGILDFYPRAGLFHAGHLTAGGSMGTGIFSAVNAAGLAASLVGQSVLWAQRDEIRYVNSAAFFWQVALPIVSAGGTLVADVALAAASARRQNERRLSRLTEEGVTTRRMIRAPRRITLEAGGASLARAGYSVEVLRHVVYADLLGGAAVTSAEPFEVGPSVLARVTLYPFGRSTGAVRLFLGPVFVADYNFSEIGTSLGYEMGTRFLIGPIDLFLASRSLFNLGRPFSGNYLTAGLAL